MSRSNPHFYLESELTGSAQVVLYLSYFYKHTEMGLRLSLFWVMVPFADIIAAFLAYGIMHMRGVLGYSGWRWMLLIEVRPAYGNKDRLSLQC